MDDAAGTMDYPGSAFDAQWRGLVCPPDYRNPAPRPRYHLAVVGAGPSGLVTAIAAAGLGAKVALIEKRSMGGDCLNVGCVPSKTLLEQAHARSGPPDFETAFSRLREVRAALAQHDSVERFTRAGVDVFLGAATFIDGRTLAVGRLRIAARRFVIATGARPALPPIAGLAEARPLTNETVFDLRRQPASIAILGAGPVGCELAQAFARLGTRVVLIEQAERVLPGELDEASRAVGRALAEDGVMLELGTAASRIERHDGRVSVTMGAESIEAEEILVAAGRRPNTDELNLAAASVATDEHGLIVVDERLRTSNPKIFAAGDACSRLQFTHAADAHARIVVQNALFAPTASTRKLRIPHCTYTQPEVARIGPHRGELDRDRTPYDVYRLRFAELDRGRAQGDDDGFVEILTEPGKDKILGGTIVGRDAGEQIAGICIAMSQGIGLGQFASTVLPYPTRAEYLRRLADAYNRGRLTPLVKSAFGKWFEWTA